MLVRAHLVFESEISADNEHYIRYCSRTLRNCLKLARLGPVR